MTRKLTDLKDLALVTLDQVTDAHFQTNTSIISLDGKEVIDLTPEMIKQGEGIRGELQRAKAGEYTYDCKSPITEEDIRLAIELSTGNKNPEIE